MRTLLTIESMAELASVREPPCLSLFQPTYRCYPENEQDPIRFGNLVKELDRSLQQKYSAVEARHFLKPFEALAHDPAFWNHTLDGLAVFGDPNLFRVFRLQRPLAELAIVADSFHTKPLRRFLQSVGSYQVRVLSAGVRDCCWGCGLGSTRAAYVQPRRSVGYAVERRTGEN